MTSSMPGPVMLDLESTGLSDCERERLRHPATGGVILFARNYESPDQVERLIANIRSARDSEILVAVDQEGGRVQRFQTGLTRLPAAAEYAGGYVDDRAAALARAQFGGWLMASELLSLGVDFSFAPVLDVDCGISEIIGDRAFSDRPEVVANLALAFRAGMNQAGMAAVGKHFPGHGGVALDSHLALPEDARSLGQLMQHDLQPFQRLIDAGLEGIMPAHVVYPAIDSRPAGFSRTWIETVLRGRMGFSGAVFSDDLSMEGAAFAGGFAERARQALAAGCDMVLVCNQPEATDEVLEAVGRLERRPASCARILSMRARGVVNRSALLRSDRWRQAVSALQDLTVG